MLNQINVFSEKIKVKHKHLVCSVLWIVNTFGSLKVNYLLEKLKLAYPA